MKNVPLSLGVLVTSKDPLTELSVDTLIEIMKNDQKTKSTTELIRKAVSGNNKEKANELKKKLKFFVTGKFKDNVRKNENLITTSACVLDIDKLSPDQLKSLVTKISKDPRTFIAFRSPSGNGLKVIFIFIREITCPEEYSRVYKLIAEEFSREYGVKCDATSDACRATYIPHADKVFFNQDATPIDIDKLLLQSEEKGKQKGVPHPEVEEKKKHKAVHQSEGDGKSKLFIIEQFFKSMTEKNIRLDYPDWFNVCMATVNTIGEAGREPFIKYSIAVDPDDTDDAASRFYDDCMKNAKGKITIGTIYRYAEEHGIRLPSGSNPASKSNSDCISAAFYMGKKEIEINHAILKGYLSKRGFKKINLGENNLTTVLDRNGILTEVFSEDLYAFIEKEVSNLDPERRFQFGNISLSPAELSMVISNRIDKRNLDKIELQLPITDFNEYRSQRGHSTLFFKNTTILISKDGHKVRPDLLKDGKQIWARDLIDHDFTYSEEQGVFERFCYACVDRNGKNGRHKEIVVDHQNEIFCQLKRAIGYMTSDAYTPSFQKLIVFCDDRPISNRENEANGGSGKDLICTALRKVFKNSVSICGKRLDSTNRFAMQSVPVGVKIIHISDVKKNVDIEWFYNMTTNNLEIERKGKTTLIIPAEKLPRIVLTSNYILNTTSGSSARRRFIDVLFSDRYSDDYQPKDDFGADFFVNWSKEEWNRFYSFMVRCSIEFHEFGLNQLEDSANIKYQRLAAKHEKSLIDWLLPDGWQLGETSPRITLGKAMDKKALFESFKDESGSTTITQTTFTRFLKDYAEKCNCSAAESHSGTKYFITFSPKVELATREIEPVTAVNPVTVVKVAPLPADSPSEFVARKKAELKACRSNTVQAGDDESPFDDL